jgi:hypothetical protein
MHIKKNICESILGTLLQILSKSKYGEKARLDMQHMGIREDQHSYSEYMPSVADLLYSKVISNYIIVSIAHLFILLIGSLLLLPYSESVPFPISLYIQFLIY